MEIYQETSAPFRQLRTDFKCINEQGLHTDKYCWESENSPANLEMKNQSIQSLSGKAKILSCGCSEEGIQSLDRFDNSK